MKKYLLDTNLYIRAFRSRDGADALEQYLLTFTPNTYLSSIVLHELLVGANAPTKAREIEDRIAAPLDRVGRIVTPSHDAWRVAGTAISQFAKKEKRELRTIPKSLVNDFLLAASCRESGATLLTENAADFESISKYVALSFEPPWPT